jgi:hypothetical protein
MKPQNLAQAVTECERFLAAAERLTARATADPTIWPGCIETGSVRRASLDLTRALADLRKPD